MSVTWVQLIWQMGEMTQCMFTTCLTVRTVFGQKSNQIKKQTPSSSPESCCHQQSKKLNLNIPCCPMSYVNHFRACVLKTTGGVRGELLLPLNMFFIFKCLTEMKSHKYWPWCVLMLSLLDTNARITRPLLAPRMTANFARAMKMSTRGQISRMLRHARWDIVISVTTSQCQTYIGIDKENYFAQLFISIIYLKRNTFIHLISSWIWSPLCAGWMRSWTKLQILEFWQNVQFLFLTGKTFTRSIFCRKSFAFDIWMMDLFVQFLLDLTNDAQNCELQISGAHQTHPWRS